MKSIIEHMQDLAACLLKSMKQNYWFYDAESGIREINNQVSFSALITLLGQVKAILDVWVLPKYLLSDT